MTTANTNDRVSILRPGLLVSLKTEVPGGVRTQRIDLPEDEASLSPSTETSRIVVGKVTREITDPAEHGRAEKARNKARAIVRSVCVETSFGLLCPKAGEVDLRAAVAEAQAVASEHNATATWSRVSVFAVIGEVAASDELAARGIASEIRDMLGRMEGAVARLDVKAIRDAANQAKRMEAMLSPDLASKASDAIAAARSVARDIVKRVSEGGEVAAVVLSDMQRLALDSARVAFADLDVSPVVAGDELPSVDLARAGAVDMDAAPVSEVAPIVSHAGAVDLAPIDEVSLPDIGAAYLAFDPLGSLDMDVAEGWA